MIPDAPVAGMPENQVACDHQMWPACFLSTGGIPPVRSRKRETGPQNQAAGTTAMCQLQPFIIVTKQVNN